MDHPALIQKASGIIWDMIFGDENFEIVTNRDKPSIKHPMHCS